MLDVEPPPTDAPASASATCWQTRKGVFLLKPKHMNVYAAEFVPTARMGDPSIGEGPKKPKKKKKKPKPAAAQGETGEGVRDC